jgi:hypothetical protein
MSEPGRTYMSYLLRLWQVQAEEDLAWRASLEDTRTGERQGFASLDDLLDSLRRLTKQTSEISSREENGR